MPVLATTLLPRLAIVGVLAVSSPPVLPACNADSSNNDGEVFTAADGTTFRVEVVATGLEIPWSLTFTPDGRLFVTERPARVRVVQNGQLLPTPALTLTDAWANGEAGVLGLAVDPAFALNRFVYLLYTQDRGTLPPVNRVVRYRELNNTLAEAVVIFDGIPGALTHDGGRVRFGPDGLLYVTMGDNREASDAQDLAAFTGKIFRLNADGTTPPSNPLASPVYSYGHRNPQGIDWHPVSGDLWATEHGDIGNDEVNRIVAGGNYRLAGHRGQQHDARHDDAGAVLLAGDCALGRVVLRRPGDPRVPERPLLCHPARRASPQSALRPCRPEPRARR